MNTRNVKTAGPAHTDAGVALIMVLVGMLVLAMFATVALTYSTQTLKTTRHTQDSIAALAAAQGGVDDYIARLNHDDSYWQKMPDCLNVAMQKPSCTPTKPFGWAPLPGAGTTSSFHYDVSTTNTLSNGTIDLTVTGKANKVNRTIKVTLRRGGFGEFLYYTDYETVDPSNQVEYPDSTPTCNRYFWDPSTPRNTSDCTDIVFVTGDVINGPTHSNDAIKMDGAPRFLGDVTTSYPNCRPINGITRDEKYCYRSNSTGTNPDFVKGVSYRDLVSLPTSAADLDKWVDPAKTATPGCLFTGPTRIKFLPPVPGGLSTMQVWSPYSVAATPALNPGCVGAGLASTLGQNLPLPPNNIIIVRDIPSGQALPRSDNRAQTTQYGSCAAGTIGDGFPKDGDAIQILDEAKCRNGNAYIEGDQFAGQLTISANNIIITGNLKYYGDGTPGGGTKGNDVLGLIATSSVKIYHPTLCSSYSNGKCTGTITDMNRPNGSEFVDPVVQAAILTLLHSFSVQHYEIGSKLGFLHLFGSFAQKYRGPVGTGGASGTGYLKDYVYDTRLRYAPPPHFLDPIAAAWGVKTFGELAAAYQGS